jgi:hypothetical protein
MGAADRVDLRLPALSVGDVVMESARHAVSMRGTPGCAPRTGPLLPRSAPGTAGL